MNKHTSDDSISALRVEFHSAVIEDADDIITMVASNESTVVFSAFASEGKTDLLLCLKPEPDKSIEKLLRERAKKYTKIQNAVLVRVEALGISENAAAEIALSTSGAPPLGIWKSDVGISVCFEN